MAHTRNSVVIKATYDKVFDMSNDISRWKEFFKEYVESDVLETSGNKIVFKLTHENGRSWESYRLLFKEDKFAYASRVEPMAPFEFMKIIWLYREVEGGTEMTWIQDFKMAAGAKFNDEQAEKMINDHSLSNMKIFKEIIEKE
ncbi:MAG: SRPBCC family protein [Candidatus Omnitrophica bacterium]|nr:SRPBCC family protein [Candidatus Omnitrophota bacterium]